MGSVIGRQTLSLLLCTAVALVLGSWLLWHAGEAGWALLLGSLLALLLLAAAALKLGLQLKKSLLWRRRRHPRPSREVLAERCRIAADLHDNVGSQLVHAMNLLEHHGERDRALAAVLEQCLLDLRLVVDSMDAMEDSLAVRLARLRHRLQPVLDRRGIAMHWRVAEPLLDAQGPGLAVEALPRGDMAQQLLAIVHEAVSNMLQHAEASALWVVLEPLPPSPALHGLAAWQLRVEDDGKGLRGMPPAATQTQGGHERAAAHGAGMGLANMHRRARAMGAELVLAQRPGGGSSLRVRW